MGDVVGLMLKNRILWLGAILFLISTCLAVQPKAIGAQASTENTATKEPFTLLEIEKLLEGGGRHEVGDFILP